MKSLPSALLSTALVVFLSSTAAAADHSGLTLRMMPGVGIASGAYQYKGLSRPGYGVPVGMLEMDSRLTGPTLSAAADLGWWVSPCFALLAEAGASVQLGWSNGGLSGTKISAPAGWQAMLVADEYLSDTVHIQIGGGYARTGFMHETQDFGTYDNIVEPSAVSGPVVALGGGYDFSDVFGIVTRLGYAHLSNDDSFYRPVTFSLLASFTLF